MSLPCRKCDVPLVEGDEALAFDVERRITTSGTVVRIIDVTEYEHVECPASLF